MELSGTGVWDWGFREDDRGEIAEAAAELEELGYSAIWLPGGSGGPVLEMAAGLLGATREILIATGILNVWMHDPADVAAGHARLTEAHPGRFLLGLGVGHAPQLEPGRWGRPLGTMREYLDALDAAATPVTPDERCLAALGPRMLELARDRSAGAHPYYGEPEQAVVLETDAARARAAGREHMERYLRTENYTKNLRRLGYGDQDLADGGSDLLVDEIVAWGDDEAIRRRVQEHREAGADHVCVQVLPRGDPLPRQGWRELAPALVDL